MKIDCLGTVGIIHTEKKSYWYNRKGFNIGKRYVKAKKIMCVQKLLMPTPISTLRRVTMNLGKTFSAPKMLTHIMASVSEMSTGSADR
jgi:hypothetical protein